jgi:hypothetical protein
MLDQLAAPPGILVFNIHKRPMTPTITGEVDRNLGSRWPSRMFFLICSILDVTLAAGQMAEMASVEQLAFELVLQSAAGPRVDAGGLHPEIPTVDFPVDTISCPAPSDTLPLVDRDHVIRCGRVRVLSGTRECTVRQGERPPSALTRTDASLSAIHGSSSTPLRHSLIWTASSVPGARVPSHRTCLDGHRHSYGSIDVSSSAVTVATPAAFALVGDSVPR